MKYSVEGVVILREVGLGVLAVPSSIWGWVMGWVKGWQNTEIQLLCFVCRNSKSDWVRNFGATK
jgi:hypothetical protein